MRSLNTLADQGKILYLGVSDTPAWIVSKANQYARDHGLRQFVVYQGRWSASNGDFERDIIPMCEAEGMGIVPWGALGSGNYKTEEQRQKSEGRSLPEIPEADLAVSKVLELMGKEKGTIMTSVAYDQNSCLDAYCLKD
jgi:aryl-alcohol dehydrogenase-like predicted oxidoreductase